MLCLNKMWYFTVKGNFFSSVVSFFSLKLLQLERWECIRNLHHYIDFLTLSFFRLFRPLLHLPSTGVLVYTQQLQPAVPSLSSNHFLNIGIPRLSSLPYTLIIKTIHRTSTFDTFEYVLHKYRTYSHILNLSISIPWLRSSANPATGNDASKTLISNLMITRWWYV